MIMDVEGRTAPDRLGKSRWAQTKCNNPGNVLVFSDHGLQPAASHQGVAVKVNGVGDTVRKHLTPPAAHDEKRGGKRTVEPVHALTSEEAKRLAGRYGLRKVNQEHKQPKIYLHGGATGSQTCEERAAKVVSEAGRSFPELAARCEQALCQGGHELLIAEQLIKKARDAQRWNHFKQQHQQNKPPSRHGDPENLSKLQAPFETDVAGSKPPQQFKPHRRQFAAAKTQVAPAHHGKRYIAQPGFTASVPFDVADGTAPYPEPPGCGVRSPLYASRHSKRYLDAPTDNRDVDSVTLERAKSHKSRDNGIPDFIFGSESTTPVKRWVSVNRYREVGPSLLEHDPKPTTDARPMSRFAAVKYKKTSLW